MLARAAHFLSDAMAGIRPDAGRQGAVQRRVMGNGLRELDIFLTDIIAEARLSGRPADRPRHVAPLNDPYHRRRIYSAAEAYRRSADGLGWRADHYRPLKSVRAVQNRLAFQRRASQRQRDASPADLFCLATACALYVQVAREILGAARGRAN